MKSMTGYGRSEKRIEKHTFTVEMKSVNHRYCDIAIRLPRSLLMIEDQFKKKIQEKIHRGKLDVYVTLHSSEATNKKVTIDWSLAQEYMTSLEHVKEQFHLQGNLQLSDLLRIEGLFSMEEIEEDVGRYRDTLIQCVEEATEQLVQMRMSEGAALCQDIKTRIRGIQRVIKELEQVAGKVKVHYAERLEERMKEFLQGRVEVAEQTLLNEVALFAEKADVSEELTRLESHCVQVLDTLDLNEPVGRKLDFIVQEMNREVNTIGSKANDIQISQFVVECKSILEKIREQVQNIE